MGLSFLVLQNIRTAKDPSGHWFVLSVSFDAKRFEILYPLRGEDGEEMIKHANILVDAFKIMYRVNYSQSRKQIDGYELMYITVRKQGPTLILFTSLSFISLSRCYVPKQGPTKHFEFLNFAFSADDVSSFCHFSSCM